MFMKNKELKGVITWYQVSFIILFSVLFGGLGLAAHELIETHDINLLHDYCYHLKIDNTSLCRYEVIRDYLEHQ